MTLDAIELARQIAASLLAADGRLADARIVTAGGGDDFTETRLAMQITRTAANHAARLERALRCYADATFWDADCPEASLAFHDQGEIARSALMGRELYAQHRD